MSSIMDSGRAAEVADRIKASDCPKAKLSYSEAIRRSMRHEWASKGSWPSSWGECKNCGAKYYDK